MSGSYYVYVMSNASMTLYTGMTNDLRRRVYEHQSGKIQGFTQKYNIKKLVYYEIFNQVTDAIAREKQLKSWSRQRKLELIGGANPKWKDLALEHF